VEVAAVCTRRPESAREAAERFGIPEVIMDYDEMLRRPDIDAVSIVTPVPLHHSMSMAALKAGKHVICEKPFTTNASLAHEMWRTAQESGKTAMIAHEFRFSSGRMRAKELIDEGYIGDLRFCAMRLVQGGGGGGRRSAAAGANEQPGGPPAYSAARDQAAMGAGFLWGLGSHYIDCLRHWFGEVESVSGDVTNFSPERMGESGPVKADADDTFSFTLHFANGGFAQMIASRAANFGSGAAVEVYGSKGTLFAPQRGVNPPAHGTLLGGQAGDEKLQELEMPERLQPFQDERDDRLMPFRLLVREFLRGIEEGTSPAPNFYDGFRCQQILDAVRESSATGRRVEIALE
jgi:predicted dehydrogenase